MKTRLLLITSVVIVFFIISFVTPNLSKVYGSCEMTKNDTLQFAIGYQWTNGILYIDNAECIWKLFGVIPIASLLSEETSFQNFSIVQYAYASCVATIIPEPCFDAFMGSTEPMTQKSIMENFARYLELNYPDWQMSDRQWDDFDGKLRLPAIICTEFVSGGVTHYRMAQWVDPFRISSFENHQNNWMCNKWLPPVDDGVKITWDKLGYLPNDVGVVKVTYKEMNLDPTKLDSFDIHVWSDTDHDGIELTVTETDPDSGVFEGTVFFTPKGESKDTTLLVEDAVYAEYKSSIRQIKIVDVSKDIILDASRVNDSRNTENPSECWYQDNKGNFFPCPTDDHVSNDRLPWYFLVAAYWPVSVIAVGIAVAIVFIIWRKRK
ncbi:hypothetical protein [Nitrosopumilus sp.]|uniref:hypothetical protein n=1 Tax=Nitrosopumilus sp. TaxID=2024843 RepID=UPI00242B1E6A|nr:hypothetical protein [Nitrosopumilus sp.]